MIQCFLLSSSFCVLALVFSALLTLCGFVSRFGSLWMFPVQQCLSAHWFGGRSLRSHNMLSITDLVSPRNPCLLVSLGASALTDHREGSRPVLAIILLGTGELRTWFLVGKSGAGQTPRLICFLQTEQKL